MNNFCAEDRVMHSICEYKLRKALGMEVNGPYKNLSHYDNNIEDFSEKYVGYVMDLLSKVKKTCNKPIILIGQRLDYTKYVKAGFDTVDCLLIANGTFYIVVIKDDWFMEHEIKLKLKLYALGVLETFDCLYDIDTICMTIYQPQSATISTYISSRKDLLEWAEIELISTAEMHNNGM